MCGFNHLVDAGFCRIGVALNIGTHNRLFLDGFSGAFGAVCNFLNRTVADLNTVFQTVKHSHCFAKMPGNIFGNEKHLIMVFLLLIRSFCNFRHVFIKEKYKHPCNTDRSVCNKEQDKQCQHIVGQCSRCVRAKTEHQTEDIYKQKYAVYYFHKPFIQINHGGNNEGKRVSPCPFRGI